MAVGAGIEAARYSADGVPDASYGVGGVATLANGFFEGGAVGAALDGTGVVLASNFLVARLTAGGLLDPSFAPCGVSYNSFIGAGTFDTTSFTGAALARQPDGKLVVVGRGRTRGGFGMLRYAPGTTARPGSRPRRTESRSATPDAAAATSRPQDGGARSRRTFAARSAGACGATTSASSGRPGDDCGIAVRPAHGLIVFRGG
ncbi:MAG TPA: hypothetical protein VKA21_12255 [Candidatus Binatia bacterium]|nr:hypothetical protein [Candidatus Binatia bacterium]